MQGPVESRGRYELCHVVEWLSVTSRPPCGKIDSVLAFQLPSMLSSFEICITPFWEWTPTRTFKSRRLDSHQHEAVYGTAAFLNRRFQRVSGGNRTRRHDLHRVAWENRIS